MKLTSLTLTSLTLLIGAAASTKAGNQVVVWGEIPDPSVTNAIAVSGGDGFALALRADGIVVQVSRGPMEDKPPPADLTNAISIAAGDNVAVALRADGTVRVWGADIGDPPTDLTNVVAVSAGWEFCAALKADGTVRCWGGFAEPPGLSNVVAIAAGGGRHLAVLKGDGTVMCWGGYSSAVTNVPPGLSNVAAITAGYEFTVALKSDGTVVAWGENSKGQCDVPASLTNVVAVSAENASHVLALKRDGTVVAWGDKHGGALDVPPGLSNVIAISSGSSLSLAIVGDRPPVLQTPLSATVMDGQFLMRFHTQSRRVYQPEFTDSLGNLYWAALPLMPGNGAVVSLPAIAATNSQRFFRVRQW
jgi:hypothetical protein